MHPPFKRRQRGFKSHPAHQFCRDSTAAVQPIRNRQTVGSNPTSGPKFGPVVQRIGQVPSKHYDARLNRAGTASLEAV
jgi:hypothetical protein